MTQSSRWACRCGLPALSNGLQRRCKRCGIIEDPRTLRIRLTDRQLCLVVAVAAHERVFEGEGGPTPGELRRFLSDEYVRGRIDSCVRRGVLHEVPTEPPRIRTAEGWDEKIAVVRPEE